MKKILIFTATFAFGALIGAITFWLCFQHSLKRIAETGMGVLASSMYMYEVNEANEQFNNPNKEIAIYALNRALRNLELFQQPNHYSSSCRTKAATLAKYNIRLAELYVDKGDEKNRNSYLNNAIKQYELMGWKFNNIEAIQNISTNNYFENLQEAIHKYAERIPTCLEKK